MCLSLTVPSRAYPRGSLVRVGLEVRNVGKFSVWPQQIDAPEVEVVDRAGAIVYPPGLTLTATGADWKSAGLQLIKPGSDLRYARYLVLRAGGVRALLLFSAFAPGPHTVTLRTRTVRLRLTGAAPVKSTLRALPPVSLHVARPPGAQGPLYHAGWFSCTMSNGGIVYGGSGFYEGFSNAAGFDNYLVGQLMLWVPSAGNKLRSGCSSPLEWHVIAGWLGQPVVTVDYHRR